MMWLFHLLIVFYQLTHMERFAPFTAPMDIKSAVLHLLVAGSVDHGVRMPTPSFVMVCIVIFYVSLPPSIVALKISHCLSFFGLLSIQRESY